MVGATNATSNRYWARGKWSTSMSGWKEFAMYGGGGSGDVNHGLGLQCPGADVEVAT